jgi:hypothetical protein
MSRQYLYVASTVDATTHISKMRTKFHKKIVMPTITAVRNRKQKMEQLDLYFTRHIYLSIYGSTALRWALAAFPVP